MDDKTQHPAADCPAVDLAALSAAREDAALWQARTTYLQTQAQQAEEARAALQQEVLILRSQMSGLEAYAADMQTRLAQAEALLESAQGVAPAGTLLTAAAAQPAIVDIVDDLAQSADPANRYAQRPLAQIQQLVLHHSAVADAGQTPQQMAEFHVNDLKHQWPAIGFHFFIAGDGVIYQTNRLETACYHVIDTNLTGVGIVLAGQFSHGAPLPAQMASTAALLAWLMQELRLPLESIVGHSELADQHTDCPGAAWLGGWKQALLELVRQRCQAARRPLYHYVLFWQTEAAVAEAEWQAAAHYVARFRPVAGFSPQEASLAENVTIVGGTTGVSAETEEMLCAAGCRVQRITGRNYKDMRSLLDGMARDGRRFLTT